MKTEYLENLMLNSLYGFLKKINLKKEKPSKQLKSKTVYYKIQWPTAEEMSRLVWEKPLSNLAEDLGVSDKSVAKFCLKNSIEKPPRGYWLKTRPLG